MKFNLLTILLLSFFILVPLVSAQEATLTPRGVQNREEARIKVENKKEEIQHKITAIKRERIRSYYGKMVVRLEATIERIQKLITRLETRISKIEESDNSNKIDIPKARADVALAKTKLADVEAELSYLNIEDIISSDNPKEEFKNVINSVKLIKDGLKEVHKLLVQTIGDIKGLRIGNTNEE